MRSRPLVRCWRRWCRAGQAARRGKGEPGGSIGSLDHPARVYSTQDETTPDRLGVESRRWMLDRTQIAVMCCPRNAVRAMYG